MPRRFVTLRGAVNLRDLGGHPTTSGRRTAWGRVYRSNELRQLPPRGTRALLDRGICRAVDLRTEDQAAASPHPLRESLAAEYVSAPLFTDSQGYGWDAWPGHHIVYSFWLRERAERIAAAVTAIALSPGPVLVNCSAGIDRTGVVTALILTAVGVPAGVVAREYALSAHAYRADLPRWIENAVARGMTREEAECAVTIRSEPMLQVLRDLQTEWGGARSYLLAAGVPTRALTALNRTLLEAAS